MASCYSSSYRHQLAANVALISDLSDKLSDYCRSDFALNGTKLSSEEMGEFYYALEKAQSFAAMDTAQSAMPSYHAFNELLARYAAFVKDADQYRLAAVPNPSVKVVLARDHNLVKIDAAKVMAALDQSD
ncbi:MAG TPA: hypothetical protein VGI47_07850 [Candidatus Binataceae bacterium]